MSEVSPLFDPVPEYVKKTGEALTLEALTDAVKEFRPYAEDAYNALPKNDDEFLEYRAGIRKERKGEFAGEDFALRYGDIMMPELMMRVEIVAAHFKCPWGLAFNRLQEAGKIIQKDGYYVYIQETP